MTYTKPETDGEILFPDAHAFAYDTFSRLRTSSPFTLFNTTAEYDANPLYWDTIAVGTGAISSNTTQSAVQLSVGTTSGDSIKYQTHNYLRYQPGKSQLIVFTGVLGAKTTNLVRRAGYYDNNNGVFFEVSASDIAVVRRTSTSGSPVDNRVVQSAWNVDTLDGSNNIGNPSGLSLDVTTMQLMFIDLQWLSIGIVRWGFEINGIPTICHIGHHANILTLPYMQTASLPVRYELTNTGTTSGSNTLLAVCSTVITEGDEQDQGTPFGITTGTTTKGVSGALVPIMSIRPKSTFNSVTNRGLILPAKVDIISDQNIVFELWLNGALTNASFASVDTNSITEYDTAATVITGGTRLYAGLLSVTGTGSNSSGIAEALLELGKKLLSLNAAGNTADILTLTASKIATNATTVSGCMNWLEQR